MTNPIIESKIRVPWPRRSLVSRSRLLDRLDAGLHAKLTLVSAPAGSGKTTLISTWAAASSIPVAWLSLDHDDNDPTRFLTYLIAALREVAAIGDEAQRTARTASPPTVEILTTVLNDVGRLARPLVLVLDDYHVIHREAVHHMLDFILAHQPPHLHLLLTTREDPPLPLARHRVRNDLNELRTPELHFTTTEAAAFLNDVMHVNLELEDVATLSARTEGWVAGLQLAALSLRDQPNRSAFVQGFAGNDRLVLTYLVDEVLAHQPQAVRQFLLHTALLDHLNGPLCDAVTGQTGSQKQLETLERQNYFLVPLDGRRHAYRYHHLFAEALRARLHAEQPGQARFLHRRASAWFEQHDLPEDAIRHALAAQDFERAASMIELAVPKLRRSLREEAILGWLNALPDDLLRDRPVLSVHHAKALLRTGDLHKVEVKLRTAERSLGAPDMVVVDEAEFRRLPAEIAVYRAATAMTLGTVGEAERHAQHALHLTPNEDHLARGAASGFLGLTALHTGDLEAARGWWAEAEMHLLRAGHTPDAIGTVRVQADILVTQGRLRDALHTYERGLQVAHPAGEAIVRGSADMHVGMSELYREWNDLTAARQHLQRNDMLGPLLGLPQHEWRARVALAGVHAAQGELDDALRLLDEAQGRYVPDFFPVVRPIPAMKVQILLVHGHLRGAEDWVRAAGVTPQDDVTYVREFELVTLARVLLARAKTDVVNHTPHDIQDLLTRLERAAVKGGRNGSLIEILVLQALALDAEGEGANVLIPLGRALELAEPEGYARLFLREGARMTGLLNRAKKRGITPSYARDLLAALDPTTPAPRPAAFTGETLSDRELTVLRWLASDLSGPDIARELGVSLNTLRTHTKRIYDKLGVHDRRGAVRRARDLNVI
ncbi:LuxR C-terminal-related transcriptional regulator [Deinococcus peraridilitoris]|uniref:LuxR C-terminal-related transcriptional regulator n=1 Tax=Deinococcus peraridilitoris TaxID=432329 RepID=UPI00059DF765|nr:LuxR C-terminal-related transcriptional regulator [Deinococcus peraridilitoris]